MLLTASRDLLFLGLFVLVLFGILISKFVGSTALVEKAEMQVTYLAAISRLIINLGLILFIVFHVRRSFENKEVELLLSKPISRQKFVLSYYLGFTILAVIISISSSVLIFSLSPVTFLPTIFWSFSVLCENLIIISFAILASFMLKSAISASLASLAFYSLARMMGFFVSGVKFENFADLQFTVQSFSEVILIFCSIFLPRLDLFSKTEWLLYGNFKMADFWVILVSISIYPAFLFLMTLIDFKKREF